MSWCQRGGDDRCNAKTHLVLLLKDVIKVDLRHACADNIEDVRRDLLGGVCQLVCDGDGINSGAGGKTGMRKNNGDRVPERVVGPGLEDISGTATSLAAPGGTRHA